VKRGLREAIQYPVQFPPLVLQYPTGIKKLSHTSMFYDETVDNKSRRVTELKIAIQRPLSYTHTPPEPSALQIAVSPIGLTPFRVRPGGREA